MSVEVAVVIPIYRRPSSAERLSLFLAERLLANYQTFVVVPESLCWEPESDRVVRIPNEWFSSINAYASLMVSPSFYRLFESFQYVLILQADCLVFEDLLSGFCGLGFDYIAPLILGRDDGHWPDRDIVGVGGLSLRKVSSFLRVLNLLEQPEFEVEARALRGRIERNGAEDMFWSLSAPLVDPSYQVAPPEVALAFGYEGDPARSYRRSGGRKPFACHHWNRLLYFLWYLPWIPLPLGHKLRLFPAVFCELLIQEVRDQGLRVLRFLRRHLPGPALV
jgi:hypothetical protein